MVRLEVGYILRAIFEQEFGHSSASWNDCSSIKNWFTLRHVRSIKYNISGIIQIENRSFSGNLIFEVTIHNISGASITVDLPLKATVLVIIRPSVWQIKSWRKVVNRSRCGSIALVVGVRSCCYWSINSSRKVKNSSNSSHIVLQICYDIIVDWRPRSPHGCIYTLKLVWRRSECNVRMTCSLNWYKRPEWSRLKSKKFIVSNCVCCWSHWRAAVDDSTFWSSIDSRERRRIKGDCLRDCAHVNKATVCSSIARWNGTTSNYLNLSNIRPIHKKWTSCLLWSQSIKNASR